MAIEIEHKFLLSSNHWRQSVRKSVRLRQGYLSNEVNCSVRLRTSAEQAWLNIKSITIGNQRHEYEYEVPLADANEMLDTLARKPLIEKTRHFVEIAEHTWEIDEFEGDNAGLIVAEIELISPNELFEKPSWVGQEVTSDLRYYNTNLSRQPYNTWPTEQG